MTTFFQNVGMGASDVSLRCLGSVAPKIVNAVYPMEALTNFHYSHHLPGLTGRWMDTGASALGGTVKGSFHRLAHGHHVFEDGFKILVNEKLKFGEFLHHLGMDSLTSRGIPTPLLPTALGQQLVNVGFSQQFAHEMMTLNVPKVLGGSLGLVCAGTDVFACFSDAIPHTFLAAGMHFGFGALDMVFGLFPPNVLLLTAGAGEIGAGIATTYRTIVDPILPLVHVPGSVFLPALGQSIGIAALIGACVSAFAGSSWKSVPKTALQSASASAVSTTTSFAVAGSGFVAPFIGPLAGIVTFLIVKKLLDATFDNTSLPTAYKEFVAWDRLSVFDHEQALAFPGMPKKPIGMLKGETFLIDHAVTRELAGVWATAS